MPTSLALPRESTSLDSLSKSWVTPDLSRLPRTVKPKRYELKLDVEPEKYSYTGQVNIRIFVGSEPVPIVWLHSVGLSIHEASIQFSQFVLPVPSSKIIQAPKYGCIGIEFENPLAPQARAWLCLKFSGKISKNLEGFFSTPYVNRDGEVRLGASTMLAPTEARTFFPCFDEPDLKSIFAIETTVDEDLLVLSNMVIMDQRYGPPTSPESSKRKRTDYFQWSKEMSTYLVCLVIGQYDKLETMADNRTTVRVYTPWGQREQGKFALLVAKKSLEFFNLYFGKRYPLTKLDIVALSRLSVGAMENWGLITCRETGLIVDPNDTTQEQKQKIATLIAHEISHQWFGNLVTMKWWDFIYLNEGFATLMQYLCIDKIFPEFEIFDHFCTDTVVPAMGLDALQNSHPVEVPLKDPSEISQVFDKITYCKGAAVLHMLHEYVGEEDFKTGIQNYIHQFSYGNATTEDLWKYLSLASSKNVGAMMHSWIRELGFPIVFVSFESPNDEDKDKITLKFRQERFTSYSGCDREMLWSIPLEGIYTKNGMELQKFGFLFDKKTAHLTLEGFDMDDPACWIKINPKLTGFYRVHYCEQLTNRLFDNLESPNLTSIDRMGMLDDQVAMVLSESGSTVRILQLIEKLRFYEKSITVWRSVVGILHQIRSLIWPNEDLADRFDNFCASILRPMLDQLGVSLPNGKEPTNNEQCRGLLFSMLAALGDSRVLGVAKDLFKQHNDNGISIPACLREAVYKAVMVQGTRATLDKMKSLYRSADLAEERSVILSSLGYSKDPNILSEVLEFAISSEVAPQESLLAIITVASNRYGYRLAWFFFTKNIQKFLDRYSGGLFLLSRIIRGVTEGFCDRESLEEVTNFFQSHREQLIGNDQAVHQAEEHIRLHMTWRDKDLDQIRNFLDHHNP